MDFQTAELLENDLDTDKTGTLSNYNYLVITAQDEETVEEYVIMVAAEVVVVTLSTDTTVTFVEEAGDDVADLLASLADVTAYDDMTFEVLTSEGLAKTSDELFTYDVLVVTAEDGTTTETYTID